MSESFRVNSYHVTLPSGGGWADGNRAAIFLMCDTVWAELRFIDAGSPLKPLEVTPLQIPGVTRLFRIDFELDDYARVLDLLRNEGAVFMRVNNGEATIGTAAEPVGEGEA